jgi:hypothetical protein
MPKKDIPAEAVAFTVFVANHKSQLDFYGIPQSLWRVRAALLDPVEYDTNCLSELVHKVAPRDF